MRALITALFLILFSQSVGADKQGDNINIIQFQHRPARKLVVPSDWPFIKSLVFWIDTQNTALTRVA